MSNGKRASETGDPVRGTPTGSPILLNADQDVRLVPETFEVVKLAFVFTEDVDEHVAVVHQHPAAFAFTLYRDGQAIVLFLNGGTDAICHRFNLAVAVAGADDEKVGDNRVGT